MAESVNKRPKIKSQFLWFWIPFKQITALKFYFTTIKK